MSAESGCGNKNGKRIVAVVLAAGSSRRFGATKLLQKYDGEMLVRRAVRTAEQVCHNSTVLVTGNDGQQIAAACRPLGGFFVHNDAFEMGIGGSIATAVGAVRPVADAILLLLADQPLVTAAHLHVMTDAWKLSPGKIVASAYANTLGPPVIFPARFFDELAGLQGDVGAREVLRRNASDVLALEFSEGAVDIDRPEDLQLAPR